MTGLKIYKMVERKLYKRCNYCKFLILSNSNILYQIVKILNRDHQFLVIIIVHIYVIQNCPINETFKIPEGCSLRFTRKLFPRI